MCRTFMLCVLLVWPVAGCIRVKTEPIHITVDINLRVQKELSSFFDDIDAKDPTSQTKPGAEPTQGGKGP